MKKRKKHMVQGDSLDLLLDALCNMFGGIVFIALLIVLLTSENLRKSNVYEPPQSNVSENRSLQAQVELLKQKLVTLLDKNKLHKESVLAWVKHLEQAKSQKELAIDSQISFEELLKKDQQTIALFKEKLERIKNTEEILVETREHPDTTDIDAEIKNEEEHVKDLRESLASLTNRRVIHARLPKESFSQLGPLFIIVKGTRAHVVLAYDAGFNSYERRDVSVIQTGTSWDFLPLRGGGFKVAVDVETHPRFAELIRTYSNNQYLASICVDDDGHHAFQLLREALVNRGWSYNVHYLDGALKLFVGGRNGSIQ
jgi:hypothetical protein